MTHAADVMARRLKKTLVAPTIQYVPDGDPDRAAPGAISLPSPAYDLLLDAAARSLKAHGFTEILFIGETGGSQQAMRNVTETLNAEWKDSGTKAFALTDYSSGRKGVESKVNAAIAQLRALQRRGHESATIPGGGRFARRGRRARRDRRARAGGAASPAVAPSPKLDIHTHFYTQGFFQKIRETGGEFSFTTDPNGRPIITYNGARFFGIQPPMTDVSKRLEDMDRVGIDVEVVSLSTPNVFFTDAKGQPDVAKMMNDAYAELIARHPKRFKAFASIPMDAPDAALAELHRAVNDAEAERRHPAEQHPRRGADRQTRTGRSSRKPTGCGSASSFTRCFPPPPSRSRSTCSDRSSASPSTRRWPWRACASTAC